MANDIDDLNDIFGEDFGDEELERQFTSVDDFSEELPEEEEESGVSRTFLVAGFLLIGTFGALVAGILLFGGDDSADAQGTADAIRLTNQALETSYAETGTAVRIAQDEFDAQTATAIAEANERAARDATATIIEYNRLLDATRTQIVLDLTSTQAFFDRAGTLTATALTPLPSNTPTPVQVSGQISSSGGNATLEGIVISIYRDNGDQRFVAPPTPTPTLTPTNIPPSPSPTPTQPATVDPNSLTDPNRTATSSAATRNAEVAAFDATATARAQRSTTTVTPAPTVVSVAPTVEVGGEDELQLVTSSDLRVSVSLPVTWLKDDKLADQGAFFFGDSLNAIATRSDTSATPPPTEGLGGQIFPLSSSILTDVGETEVTPESLSAILSLVFLPEIEAEGGIIDEEPTSVELDEGWILHYAVITQDNETGFLALVGSGQLVATVLISAPTDQFAANRDLFLEILGSVRLQEPEGATDTAPVGGFMDDRAGRAVFMQVRADPGMAGLFQGDSGTPTPTGPTPPPPGADEPVATVTIGPDGSFIVGLPAEPGIYYLVVTLPPGDYSILIEGQTQVFTVPDQQLLDDAGNEIPNEVRIDIADRTFILLAYVLPVGGPASPTPTIDQNLSPFLQTATAAARNAIPTATFGPTAIPGAGGADILGGGTAGSLTLLALVGAGLVGLVFVVRRMRSTLVT